MLAIGSYLNNNKSAVEVQGMREALRRKDLETQTETRTRTASGWEINSLRDIMERACVD